MVELIQWVRMQLQGMQMQLLGVMLSSQVEIEEPMMRVPMKVVGQNQQVRKTVDASFVATVRLNANLLLVYMPVRLPVTSRASDKA
jgi:hypothetical protein